MTACGIDPGRFDVCTDAASDEAKSLRRICRECPVLQRCGEWAMTRTVDGFAAGLTARERRSLLKKAVA